MNGTCHFLKLNLEKKEDVQVNTDAIIENWLWSGIKITWHFEVMWQLAAESRGYKYLKRSLACIKRTRNSSNTGQLLLQNTSWWNKATIWVKNNLIFWCGASIGFWSVIQCLKRFLACINNITEQDTVANTGQLFHKLHTFMMTKTPLL